MGFLGGVQYYSEGIKHSDNHTRRSGICETFHSHVISIVYIYVGGGDSAIHGHHNDNLIMGYGTATKNKMRSVLLHDGGDQ